MINALFMGGVADGKRMQLADNMTEVKIPKMPDMRALAAMELPPSVIPTIKETTYYRVDVIFMRGVAVFTQYPNPTSEELMRMLLDGYRAEAGPNAE